MLKFKNGRITYELPNGDNVSIMTRTTEARFNQLRQILYKKYGSVYGLEEVKREVVSLQ